MTCNSPSIEPLYKMTIYVPNLLRTMELEQPFWLNYHIVVSK